MSSINTYMTNDHREIDSHFEQADHAATAQDFGVLEREATEFLRRLTLHIQAEEQLLFPTFEQRTGMTGGPSAVMRQEHRLMEPTFEEMREAVTAKDAAAYQAAANKLMDLLNQHNQKEEMMLYPMLDNALGGDTTRLLKDVKEMMED